MAWGRTAPGPERGLHCLHPWVQRSSLPEYTAWMLSEMAEYSLAAGQTESALQLGQKACVIAERAADKVEVYLRRFDQGQLLLKAGHPEEALRVLPLPTADYCASDQIRVLIALAEAYHQTGNRAQAHNTLHRANEMIPVHGKPKQRAKADALAAQL